MFLINILVASALLLSYISTFINSKLCAALSFLGLVYPILLIVNIIFVIFWISFKSKKYLLSLLIIFIGWKYIISFFNINFNNYDIVNTKNNIKVLTYNVRVFNRWNWLKDKDIVIQTVDYIKQSEANIVCLQEFYSNPLGNNNIVDSIKDKANLINAHVSYAVKNNKPSNYGIATFTNYPIIGKGSVESSKNSNFCIYSDVIIKGETIRIYNIHLESIHLGYDDYDLIKNINKTDTINVKGIRSIYAKMEKSFKKRAIQADLISQSIANCKYPIILCGDFNDTPVSYVYQTILGTLTDSFSESGNGIENTYISTFPAFRIDFIFHSVHLQSLYHKTDHINFSDHYPVFTVLKMNDK